MLLAESGPRFQPDLAIFNVRFGEKLPFVFALAQIRPLCGFFVFLWRGARLYAPSPV
jgi:hypothetical protein